MKPRALLILSALALLLPATAAEKGGIPPFSAELDPYPIQPSALQSTVDEIHARTVASGNVVPAEITACRKQVIAMYRALGIDPSLDRYTQRRFVPKHWSSRTPQPLAGDFLQPFSIDCPFYHPIPTTSPRVPLPHGYIDTFHVATIGTGGDGWGIGVAISTAKDPLRTVVQTWDKDVPAAHDRRIQLHLRADLARFIPTNTGDRHLTMIDAATLTHTNSWHFGVHDDVFTGWRVYGPHPLGSLGVGEGTNAAQFSDLVGLLRAGEATADKPIPHALFGPAKKFWKAIVYPAINWDEWVGKSDGGTGAVPYGGVIQLDPSLDLGALRLSLPARRILEAIQRFGWYLHDTGVRDLDVWSSASGEELGRCDAEVLAVLKQATLYVVPAPAKYEAPYPRGRDVGKTPDDDASVSTTRPTPTAVPPAAPPAAPRQLPAEVLAAWDDKLFAAIRTQIAAGRPALFHSVMLATDAAITRAEDNGTLALSSKAGDLSWAWSRITRAERRSLAARLRATTPAEHCLLAFHLLEAGDRDAAQPHLDLSGPDAVTVLEMFR